MTVFALHKGILSKPQVFTPAQEKKQIEYLERKRTARPFGGQPKVARHQLPNLVWKQVCQARDTPCSVGTFQKYKRLHSEANLGRAAINYLLSMNLSVAEMQAILDPDTEGDQSRADAFWQDFCTSEVGRAALNGTDFLDSHIDLANGLPAKIALYAGRFSRDMADIWLARTTILATSYRAFFDKQARSGSLFHSALYAVGAISLISLLAAIKSTDVMTLPARVLVFSPVYFAAAGLKLLGKGADALAYKLTRNRDNPSGSAAQRYKVITDISKNRAMEQLAGIAKIQNLLATPGAFSAEGKATADEYAAEQASFHSANTLTRVLSKTAGQLNSEKRMVRQIIGDPVQLQSGWAKSLLRKAPDSAYRPSTITSVLEQLQNLELAGPAGSGDQSTASNRKLSRKILHYKLQAMAGAVKVFCGPRATGLFNDTVITSEQQEEDNPRQYLRRTSSLISSVTGTAPIADQNTHADMRRSLSMGDEKPPQRRKNALEGRKFVSFDEGSSRFSPRRLYKSLKSMRVDETTATESRKSIYVKHPTLSFEEVPNAYLADRHFKSRITTTYGVNPFPDRVARESYQKVINLGLGRMKYCIAYGLSWIAGADLVTSAHAMKMDVNGNRVARFNPVQKVLQKTARLISMNAVGDKAPSVQDAIPLARKYDLCKNKSPSELLCKTKKHSKSFADQRFGSVADAQLFPQSYSPLIQRLSKAQDWTQKNAERALQPSRGNTGRAIDKFITKNLVTRGLDSGLSSDLSHGASIVLWGGIGIGTAPFFGGYPAALGASISAVTLGLSAGLVALSLGLATQASISVTGRKGFVPAMSLNKEKQ